MKNLQIGENDLIGNKFNGHDLHLYLNEMGINSNHLIANKPQSKDAKTFQIGSSYSKELREKMIEADRYYNLVAGTHTLPFDIIYNKLFLESDIVHLHLIHNYFFNVNLLPLFTSLKPTVWTIHDPWALTGHCFHPFECQKWKSGCVDCPSLHVHLDIEKDTSALNWEMKRIAFQNSQITLIVASKWMENLVKQSPLLKHFNTYFVPFGINHDIFKPLPILDAKRKFNIPNESITLMFRMRADQYKGSDLLLEALPKLKSKTKITLISIDQKDRLDHLKDQFNILEFGWVSDDYKLVELYQACDIFLMPSKVESFGMMAIEAMSCRKPIIVLEGTALTEVTQAPDIGISCKRDAKSLQETIQNLINNSVEREERAELGYQYALKKYGSENYARNIVEVYKNAIKNHKSSIYRDNVVDQLIKFEPLSADFKESNSNQPIMRKSGLISFYVNRNEKVFKIKIGKLITLFQKKTKKNKTKYYFCGILFLKTKVI